MVKQTKIYCTDHPDEALKFYCTFHNGIVCSICAVKKHKTCNDILTFPEAIERFEREQNNLFKALENQCIAIENTVSEKLGGLDLLSSNTAGVRFKIEALCEDLHRVIDTKKTSIIQRIEFVECKQKELLLAEVQAMQSLSTSASKVKQKAESAFSKRSPLNVIQTMISVQNAYCNIERASKKTSENLPQVIGFQISDELQDFLERFDTLGNISVGTIHGTSEQTDVVLNTATTFDLIEDPLFYPSLTNVLDDIDSTSDDDDNDSDDVLTSGDDNDVTSVELRQMEKSAKEAQMPGSREDRTDGVIHFETVDHGGKACWIYGITYVGDMLAVSDVSHDSLQLYDNQYSLLCESKVSFTPWDIETVNDETIAVCAGSKAQVKLFSVRNRDFVLLNSLDVGSDCISVAISNGKYFVGTRRGIVLMSEDGDVSTRIEKERCSGAMLRRADFTVSSTGEDIIVTTNAWSNKIMSLNSDGNILWEYHNSEMNPRGLAIKDKTLLVCIRNQHKIIFLTNEGEFKGDVISNGLEYPYAITHHPRAKLLAVSQWDERMSAEKTRFIKICSYK